MLFENFTFAHLFAGFIFAFNFISLAAFANLFWTEIRRAVRNRRKR